MVSVLQEMVLIISVTWKMSREKAPMSSPQRDDIGGLVSPVRKTDEETGVELNINHFPLSLPL